MKYPTLEPHADDHYIVYADYNIEGYTIPKGFSTDGFTLKTRLLRLVVDKYQPKFAPFFVLHDYLCSIDKYKEADKAGSEVLFDIEYSFRTRAMMRLISLYHRIKYGVK